MKDFKKWIGGLFDAKENSDPDPALPHQRSQPSGTNSLADDNNNFTLAMYERLRQQPGNLFFSPFSIRTALSMTEAGARGETAAQIIKTLRISSPPETQRATFAGIIQRLKPAGDRKYEMEVANSLWGQDGAPLQPPFLDVIVRQYDGQMKLVDFRGAAEAARVEINRWVEEKTRQKIHDLIPAGGLDADTRLALVNAVYFKGTWVLQFERKYTLEEPFYLETGGKVRVPLMQQYDRVGYLQTDGYQAVELFYEGDDLSMLVILPKRKDGLRALETKLSTQMLHDCVAQMSLREVKLFLPRFKITWGTVDIRDHLTALGMPIAFTRFKADFSGINGYEPPSEEALFLSAVFHKAFVEVNEAGTEAAAATAAVVMITLSASWLSKPPPVPIFRADHPFLFAILDRTSGAILFLGRMSDPSRES